MILVRTWDLLDDGCDFPPFDFIISTSAWLAQNSKVVSLICHVTSSSLVWSSTDCTHGEVGERGIGKVGKGVGREIKMRRREWSYLRSWYLVTALYCTVLFCILQELNAVQYSAVQLLKTQCRVSQHNTSHHIISYHITSHDMISHLIISYHITDSRWLFFSQSSCLSHHRSHYSTISYYILKK